MSDVSCFDASKTRRRSFHAMIDDNTILATNGLEGVFFVFFILSGRALGVRVELGIGFHGHDV